MRKFPMVAVLAMFPAFALVFLVGCPGPKTEPTTAAKTDAKTVTEVAKPGKLETIKAATEATIKGTVKFKGKEIPKALVLAAIAGHKDAAECMKGQVNQQEWIVNKDGGVANVVISLAPPAGKKFDVTDALKKPFETPVILDQPHCAYIPHVVALLAETQPLVVKNSAQISHNVKIEGAGDNVAFDSGVMDKGSAIKPRTFSKTDKAIGVQCSMHAWMNAKILVFTHPYFAVSKDDGSFEIKNVPVGETLTIYMWHESKAEKWVAKTMKFTAGENTLELEISK